MTRNKVTIDQRLKAIQNKHNKKHVKDFVFYLKSEARNEQRIHKYCWLLHNLSEWFDKDFKKATENDIRRIVAQIEGSPYTAWTKHDYKACIKTFYKWLDGKNRNFPDKVSWIKTTVRQKTTVSPSDILTREEVQKMIETTNNIRNKALVSVLYETGIRVGELMNMKINDIEITEAMIEISVTGKTGQRKVFMRGFRRHLLNWLNSHPYRNNVYSPVWVANGGNKLMSHNAICSTLKDVALKSGMEQKRAKKVRPHLFRHSLATHLASVLSEQEMKAYFGWTGASEMASIYCHLSAHDIKNAVSSKLYGLTNGEIQQKEEAFKPRVCVECGKENSPDARYCNCGTVLDLTEAVKLSKELFIAKKDEKILIGKNIEELNERMKWFERQLKQLQQTS